MRTNTPVKQGTTPAGNTSTTEMTDMPSAQDDYESAAGMVNDGSVSSIKPKEHKDDGHAL